MELFLYDYFHIFMINTCENCPNKEFFLFRILLYSVRMQENTDQKNLRIWALFTQWEGWVIIYFAEEIISNEIELF